MNSLCSIQGYGFRNKNAVVAVDPVDPNLVNWYKFNTADQTGSTVKDFVTGTYNATLVSSAVISTTQSKFGGASLYVNGGANGAGCCCSLPPFVFNGSGSIAFWTYCTAYTAGQPPFYMKESSAGVVNNSLYYGKLLRPWYSNGGSNVNPTTKMTYDTDGIDQTITGSSFNIMNTWVHLTYVFSNSVIQLYVNGTLYGTSNPYALHTNLVNTTYPYFYIGSDVNQNGAQTAYFDDFRVYNIQLTSTQVTAIYNYLG